MPLTLAKTICNLSFRTTASAMDILSEFGIVREITGKRRNRLYFYTGYLAILNEGTEPSQSTS